MKYMKRITLLFLSIVLLTACSNDTENTETNDSNSKDEVTISLTITDHTSDTVIDESAYTVEEGTILIDILDDNYEIEVTEEGFLTSIEGASQNENENIYWLYEVNGEMANEGVTEYGVKDEDEITFDLQELE